VILIKTRSKTEARSLIMKSTVRNAIYIYIYIYIYIHICMNFYFTFEYDYVNLHFISFLTHTNFIEVFCRGFIGRRIEKIAT
jgi:hypothetical protein